MRITGGRLGSAAAVLVLGATAALRAAAVDPATLGGTWSGPWNNLKFGSSGTITGRVENPTNDGAIIYYLITGNVFGCAPQDGETGFAITRGVNLGNKGLKVNEKGFPVFGDVKIRSNKAGKVTASGRKTCDGAGPKKWTAHAKLNGTTFAGTMKIVTSAGVATTNFSVTKQ